MSARPTAMTAGSDLRRAAMAVLLLWALAACGDAEQQPADEAAGGLTVDQLDGRVFVSTGEASLESPDHRLVDGTTVRLEFRGNEITLTAGCNTLFGDAAVADGRLTVSGLGGTEMGCPAELAAQDDWLTTFLAAGPDVSLDGRQLTLAGEGSTLRLTDEADVLAEPPLEGTDWRLDALTATSGNTASAEAGSDFDRAGIRIAGGRIRIETGCNQGGSEVEVVDDTIRLHDPMEMTTRPCTGPMAKVERAMLDVLAASPTYEVGSGVLTLTAPDGQGLQFSAR